MKRALHALLLAAFLLGILTGCDATTGGLRSQGAGSPYPYNSPY